MPVVPDLQQHHATRWDGVSEETLAQSLASPVRACIEACLSTDDGFGSADDDDGGDDFLRLTVSIRSAYRHQIAKAFVAAIERRLPLGQEIRYRIRTALHETLLNAVMHGHIQLESGLRDTLGGFAASHDAIESALASDRLSQSRLVIEAQWNATRLSISVLDNGVGFDPDSSHTTQHRGSGRGLLILEALCDSIAHLNGGSTIILGFEL